MLERLQSELAKGSALVELALHGPTVQIVKKAIVHSADQVGIVAQLKGPMGGTGPERMFPWTAISYVEIIP